VVISRVGGRAAHEITNPAKMPRLPISPARFLGQDALRCPHRDDIDGNPFLDLQFDQSIQNQVNHLVGIGNVNGC